MALLAGLSPIAIIGAAIASFIFGAIWYGLLSKPWHAASNRPMADGHGGPPPVALATTFVAELVMSYFLAGLVMHLARAGLPATAFNGAVSGGFIWLAFVMMPLLVNHVYQRAKPALTVIDGAHWLGVLLVQGAIVGAFALK